jgi:hypothetical protein
MGLGLDGEESLLGIPDSGFREKKYGSLIRICIIKFKYFNPKLSKALHIYDSGSKKAPGS